MIRFIHTADVHYGMENYGKIDPVTGIHTRLLDFDKAFHYCVDVALEREVDLFIFAGDAYKTTNPSPTQQRLLLRALLRLQKAGIPVIIPIGNHDNPLSFGKANTVDIFGDLPLEGFYIMSKPTSLMIHTKNGPVQIVGIPWPTRNTIAVSEKHVMKSVPELIDYITQSTSSIIAHLAQQLDPAIPAILTGHLTVSSGIFSGSEKRAIYGHDPVFLPSQLAIAPFDYIALGHLHRHQQVNPHSYPPIVYAGSIERIDFGERLEEKGFCVVTIKQKGITEYEFVKTPQRPFIQVEVMIKEGSSQTTQIIDALKKYDLSEAIVKILYHMPPHIKDEIDLHAVQRACAAALDVIGIIPVYQPTSRQKRISLKVDMNLSELLSLYLESKAFPQKKMNELISKVFHLEQQTQQEKEL
jgi:exonuclease SbcD